MIYGFTMFVEHVVGEVVIFVDDEICLSLISLDHCVYVIHSVACRFLLVETLLITFRIILGIFRYEHAIHDVNISINVFAQLVNVSTSDGEVKSQHLVFIALSSRMFSHVSISKQ